MVDIPRPVASAPELFRSKSWTIGWSVAVGAGPFTSAPLALVPLSLAQAGGVCAGRAGRARVRLGTINKVMGHQVPRLHERPTRRPKLRERHQAAETARSRAGGHTAPHRASTGARALGVDDGKRAQ
jgi:hypothetical protein